eukprot:11198564-Lingulodinium_polyedra.AAC.1
MQAWACPRILHAWLCGQTVPRARPPNRATGGGAVGRKCHRWPISAQTCRKTCICLCHSVIGRGHCGHQLTLS